MGLQKNLIDGLFFQAYKEKTWAATGQKTENGVNPIETFMYKFPNFLKN
jgi:hypothetical protein